MSAANQISQQLKNSRHYVLSVKTLKISRVRPDWAGWTVVN